MTLNRKTKYEFLDVLVMFIGLMALLGLAEFDSARKNHKLYTPGQSLSCKERKIVEQAGDSALNARIGRYNNLRADLQTQRQLAREKYHTPKVDFKKIPQKRNDLPKNILTIYDYDQFLKVYERDSIEKKYKKLYCQMAKQR